MHQAAGNGLLTPIFIYFIIIDKRGVIREFLVNVYIPCTKKLYPDPDFRKYFIIL